MLLRENFIDYQSSRLHYARAGKGLKTLLVFHGFGQDHQAFDRWVQALEQEYQFFFFDLYFHGQSIWPIRRPLEKEDWKKILTRFLEIENIAVFEIAGFSLGGKFAMATVEAFPEKVRKVILLAPDGIKTNFWYSLATYPIAMRGLFKSMVLKPGRFFGLARFLSTFGLVDRGILRFAESQMDTEEKRRRVYCSWVYFRHLRFSLDKIALLLNEHKVSLLMIVGRYDKVIPVKNMDRLLRRLHTGHIEIMESGHNDLIKNAVTVLGRPLANPSGR